MKTQTVSQSIVNDVKSFLLRVGKQVYDNGKSIYYVDYNNTPRKLTRI